MNLSDEQFITKQLINFSNLYCETCNVIDFEIFRILMKDKLLNNF